MTEINPVRQLSMLQTTSIIIGAVIGSGVFMNIPIVSEFGGNPFNSLIIWFIGGIVWLPQLMILAEMGTAYPNQGGPYFYLYKAGSPLLGFLYTWTCFLTSDTPSITIISLMAISSLKIFFPLFENPYISKILATILIFSLAYIQVKSLKTGSNFQVFLTILKTLPLALIVIIGLFFLGQSTFDVSSLKIIPNNQSLVNNVLSGISATIWAYAGFMNILYMAGEVKNPNKILPRALIGSLIFVIAAYVLISLGTFSIVPFDEILKQKGDFINPFKFLTFSSNIAGYLFAIMFFVSMIGVLNSIIMTQPRLEYATAKDGLFFEIFGKLHPKYLTPHYSITIQATFAVVLLLLGNIESLLGYFTLSYILQNGMVYGAIFFLRKRDDYKPSYKIRFYKSLTVLSIIIQLFIAYGTVIAYPLEGILASFGLIISGIPVYAYFKKKREISI